MAHYAFLDENNIVTEVITGKDETELIDGLDPETWYGNFRNQVCKRTSYNTHANVNHVSGIPFRKNYAGIGFTYNESLDAFIPPKLFNSWILDEETCEWRSPVPRPIDDKEYIWSEDNLEWQEVE